MYALVTDKIRGRNFIWERSEPVIETSGGRVRGRELRKGVHQLL
jgi:hypothetical protein